VLGARGTEATVPRLGAALGGIVPTAFPVPQAHAVEQGPLGSLLAALAGDGASPGVLGGLPKVPTAPASLARALLHARGDGGSLSPACGRG